MAIATIKYDLGKRGQLLDFILYERSTPNGWSRKTLDIAPVAGVKIGDTVKADGTLATATADVKGISLTETSATLGVCTNGDAKPSVLYRDAEVQRLPQWTDLQVAGIEALGITVLVTGK
ncbi:hypothetical protein [Pectobacterium phage Wc4-1]|uniref:Head decoration protein n=2 Tax=Arnovirus TaxID=3425109 RepID=A0A5P8D6C6_9CAUD|nr:hypothetical protein Arno162_79 [Pectobacterium phage Arno162]QFP93869.1 hypothetical protein [Pectobacterium phage Wc4]QFP94014.1 hypothetical protein [Pectobacterium phage Wc4-1]